MEGFVAYFQQDNSPVAREYSYLEQLQRYRQPTFSGTLVPSEAGAWFKSFEKTLDAMKCPDNQWVTLATHLLQGEADHWWDTAKRTIVETLILWASFQDRFFDQYFLQSYRDACISEFYMLEQGDMSISRKYLITYGASTYREVLSKALALEQNDVEDFKSKDLRGQQR
ncbi:hypothetical protein GIB67_029783 [Kingdonia uniflora]|uniref:Retrotransposon gag domain-containing protein n=1 Tax=Kingdonia uniflora TaxID=39325 RepID=A0A7J7NIY5_9MAGN|nr:hypothetical protein GIB67_029783 [Kingdonia uniflora]